ncbi:MAG: hypothetical protein GMKNLPBB_00984 [Myxococcota bacterium]|nr:hypothetical protein [Myxococcota bacterium]
MFESDFIEFFSKVHPATPAVVYLPVAAASLWYASSRHQQGALEIAGLCFLGYFVWTLSEYWLHRLVFHLKPTGPFTQRLQFILHGVHHDYPWDHYRLVMPLVPGLIGATAFYLLFWGLFGQHAMYPVFAGFAIGYVIYDTTHWYTHAGRPRSGYLKYLRREHMIHHFKEEGTRYGVSCPWWDFVFGTAGNRSIRDDSAG